MHIFLQSSKYSVCKAQELGSIVMRVYAFTQSTLLYSQVTSDLPCNPNAVFVCNLQTNVGLYNSAVLILYIPITSFKKISMYEMHFLFIPDLFHVYSSTLILEIK